MQCIEFFKAHCGKSKISLVLLKRQIVLVVALRVNSYINYSLALCFGRNIPVACRLGKDMQSYESSRDRTTSFLVKYFKWPKTELYCPIIRNNNCDTDLETLERWFKARKMDVTTWSYHENQITLFCERENICVILTKKACLTTFVAHCHAYFIIQV